MGDSVSETKILMSQDPHDIKRTGDSIGIGPAHRIKCDSKKEGVMKTEREIYIKPCNQKISEGHSKEKDSRDIVVNILP